MTTETSSPSTAASSAPASSASGRPLSIAALTFTYNENVNLPIWIKHYGAVCGEQNLFIGDRGTDDGSVDDVGTANLIKLPRNEFDEYRKTEFINTMQAALLNFYDVVIISDCDEILVPDPEKYSGLREYIEAMSVDYVRAVGIDILHMIDAELPLDLGHPILSQRQYGRFAAPSCKALISKVPMRWLPGLHSCNRQIDIDPTLFLFHTKLMDYSIAIRRQVINQRTVWSEASVKQNFGAHHRWDMERFVHQSFLVPADMRRRGANGEFEFSAEIDVFKERTSQKNSMWYIPMNIYKYIKIPEKFNGAF